MVPNSSIDSFENPNDKQPISNNKRTNNAASCNVCRQRKAKCVYLSGDQCKRCIEQNLKCISDPQKKRGPKEKNSRTPFKDRTNLNGNGLTLLALIQKTLSIRNLFENYLAASNEQPLLNLILTMLNLILTILNLIQTGNLNINSSSNDELYFAEDLLRILMTNLQNRNLVENSSGINNMQLNNDPMFTDSTQESFPSKSLVENSSVINMQNFFKTPSQKNRLRRREVINHKFGVGLHRNVSNPNTPCSSSCVTSMYSDYEQKNSSFLQFPEITPHNFADLTSPIPMPLFDNASPLITADSQAMSTLLSPFIPHATSMPSLKLGSPLINFSMDFQTTSTSPLVNFISMPFLGDATPHANFTTDPHVTSMPSLELVPPLLNFSMVNSTSLTNSTTNSQAMPLVNSEKTFNQFHNGTNSVERDDTF
ncbi:28566_t:CDS:1 [Racocetra persica]|uniref:28566_t:CDS:1 n=1 Tax=Racocetra persica TaxID=160502 RepID=A0ACA9NDC2_9GLOM|nr:28566_t:CDS:1 [Racocetra persica]